MPKISLPFKITDVYEGLALTEGLLRINDNSLIFEFLTKDAVLGLIKTEVQQVTVAFEDIEEVNFKKSMFGNSLQIRLASLVIAQKIPAQKGSNVELNIARKDADIALSFVSNIRLDMSSHEQKTSDEQNKEQLSKAIDDA